MGLRDIYRVPPGPGLAGRTWIVMVVFVVAALVLWLALPASPLAVAVTAIAVLLLVGGGVATVMASRQASEPPPRRQAPPPSE